MSRYAIDVINIAGLLVAGLGSLYLSRSALPIAHTVWRRLIPALVVSGMGALVVAGPLPSAARSVDLLLRALLGAACGFFVGYAFSRTFDDAEERKRYRRFRIKAGLVIGIIAALPVGIMGWLLSGRQDSLWYWLIIGLTAGVTFGPLGAFMMRLIAMTNTLSERQLTVVGLLLTLLGLGTQLVSPVLDLLNIPIK